MMLNGTRNGFDDHYRIPQEDGTRHHYKGMPNLPMLRSQQYDHARDEIDYCGGERESDEDGTQRNQSKNILLRSILPKSRCDHIPDSLGLLHTLQLLQRVRSGGCVIGAAWSPGLLPHLLQVGA